MGEVRRGRGRLALAALGLSVLCVAAADSLAAQGRIGMIPVGSSELRDSVTLFSTDRAALMRRWTVEYSPARRDRFKAFHADWRTRLAKVDFARLSQEGKIDYLLLDNRLRSEYF